MTLRPNADHKVGPYTFRVENGRITASANAARLWQRRPNCIAVHTEDGDRFTILREEPGELPKAGKLTLTDLLNTPMTSPKRWELWVFPAISAAAAWSHSYAFSLAALLPAAAMTMWRQKQQRVLLFALDAASQNRFKTMMEQLAQVKNARNIWHIGQATTQKIPGLYTLTIVERPKQSLAVTSGLPYGIASNLEVPCLRLDGMSWYFAPHALIVESGGTVREFAYNRFQTRTTRVNLREEGHVPPGATITGRTWRHITKDGKQQSTARDNPSYPVVAYVQTTLYTSDGLQASFLALRAGSIDPLLAAISGIAPPAYAGSDGYTEQVERTPITPQARRRSTEPDLYGEPIEPRVSDDNANDDNASQDQAKARQASGAGLWELPGSTHPDNTLALTREWDSTSPTGALTWPGANARTGGATISPLPSNCRWVRRGENISAGGIDIEGGLLYICIGGHSSDGPLDPAVIDISAEVYNQEVPLQSANMGYWPSYSDISPRARRGYLQWLAGGRCAPEADIGYVFLYFYGLERRVLADVGADQLDEFELADITEQIGQLLKVYGAQPSFRHYAEGLLHYIAGIAVEAKTYLATPPKLRRGQNSTPFQIKLALGQLTADNHPLNANWALAWAATAPTIRFGRHVDRCKREFAELFRHHFNETYPEGLRLKPGRSLLRLSYEPASAALRGGTFAPDLNNLPDVAQAPQYLELLQRLVERSAEALVPYSRKLLRVTTPTDKAMAAYLLPFAIWPEELKRPLELLWQAVGEGPLSMTQEQLLTHFLHGQPCTKAELSIVSEAAAAAGIGIEPPLTTRRQGDGPANFYLYRTSSGETPALQDTDWRKLTLGLAAGKGCAKEVGITQDARQRMDTFALLQSDFSLSLQRRLRACAAHYCEAPPSIQSVLKKISTLPPEHLHDCFGYAAAIVAAQSNEALTGKLLHAMAGLAITDTEAHRLLQSERYNLPCPVTPLQDGNSTTITTAATTTDAADTAAQVLQRNEDAAGMNKPGTIALDADRIAAIIRDTAAVSTLLAGVFEDDTPSPTQSPRSASAPASKDASGKRSVWGLSPSLSLLLKYLVRRQSWSRAALTRQCTRLGLMVDGALEAINDAAFDHLDDALTEGTDPIAINHTLAKQVPV